LLTIADFQDKGETVMLLMQPKKAANGQASSSIATGVDTGAGLLKIVLGYGAGGQRVRTPAKIVEIQSELHDELTSPEGGHFVYESGDRADLHGREFLTGSLAAWKAPTSHLRLSDNPALKAEYVLHMILGALASLPPQDTWNLHLVLSSHNTQVFRELVTSKTSGTHVVRFGGRDKPNTQVSLTVSLVVPEGAGSYAFCAAYKPDPLIDIAGHVIALDFGTSTVIPTVFAPGGKIIHRNVLAVGGCVDLLEAIAADVELVKALGTGKSASTELIRQAIEDRSFKYGTRGFIFQTVYTRHLKTWLADRLRLALSEVEEWRDAAQSLVAWGGGAALPFTEAMFERAGITPIVDACWANALGLQRMAQGRLERGK
jgi:Actin like proteins N terminal domain